MEGKYSSHTNLTRSVSIISEIAQSKEDLRTSVINTETIRPRRRFIVEPTMVMYQSCFIVMAPLTSQYVLSKMYERYNVAYTNGTSVCGTADTNSSSYLLQQEAQAASAKFILGYQLSQGIPALFIALLLGAYSDLRGRRLALIVPFIGVLFRCCIFILQQLLNLPLEVTFLGTFADGLCGSSSVMMSTCNAYISDTVPRDKRSKHLVVAEFLSNTLQAFFQISLGYIIKALGFLYPYMILVGIHMCNLTYVVFFVPESKIPSKKPMKLTNIVKGSPKTVFRKRTLPVPRHLLLINLAVFMFIILGQGSIVSIENLYLLNSPVCMDSVALGQWKFAKILTQAIGLMICSKAVLRHFDDITVIMVSCCCSIAYCIVFGVANEMWMIYAALGTRICLPITKSMLSKSVTGDEQGGMMSVVYVTAKASNLVGHSVYNNLYAATLLFFKGTTFLVFAGVMSIAVSLIITYKLLLAKTRAASRSESTRL